MSAVIAEATNGEGIIHIAQADTKLLVLNAPSNRRWIFKTTVDGVQHAVVGQRITVDGWSCVELSPALATLIERRDEPAERVEVTIKNAQAAVCASHDEVHQLWRIHSNRSGHFHESAKRLKVAWVEQSRSTWFEIGKVAGRPICISIEFATIDGIRVAFVGPTSRLIDYEMIDEWIAREMPQTAGHRAAGLDWRSALEGLTPTPAGGAT